MQEELHHLRLKKRSIPNLSLQPLSDYSKDHSSVDGKAVGGGYHDGGLFSLTFTSLAASSAFFDALPCYKGPSLGNELFTCVSVYDSSTFCRVGMGG